ncbi:MAG: DUF4845 domain-containing protein [Pseudomonadota bacterium]
MSLSTLLLLSIVLVVVSILGLRLVPPYIEYLSIQKVLTEVVNDPDARSGPPQNVRMAFSKRATINNITVINANDLAISRDGGELVLSVSYPVKVEMVGNISVCIDFEATASSHGG